MSFGKKAPSRPEYEQMEDTPYIKNLRDLSQRGYEGYKDNYDKVNVFSPETQRSLDDYTNSVYQRAEGDFDRQYRDTMKRMANRNYGQFGTLNATPALYRTDMENLSQQRKLADMAYNKALYRESLVDNELRRRYNTLNMFNEMLEKGQTPYAQDLQNWQIRNQNKDIQFENAIAHYNQKGNWGRWIGSKLDPFEIIGLSEAFGPVYANQVSGNSPKVNWSNAMNLAMTIMGAISKNPQMMEIGTKNLANAQDQYAPDMESLYSSGSGGSSLMDAIMGATGGNQSLPTDIFSGMGNMSSTINFGR